MSANSADKRPARVWIHGISGRVGQELIRAITARPGHFTLMGGADKDFVYIDAGLQTKASWQDAGKLRQCFETADVIIDFSLPDGTRRLVELLQQATAGSDRAPAVLIGTTGIKKADLEPLTRDLCRKTRVLVTPNTSVGIGLLIQAATRVAAEALSQGFDMSMLDIHHRYKLDRPSGTALLIQDEVFKSLSTAGDEAAKMEIAAQRTGGVLGEHHLTFGSDEEIVRISHVALSRALFAKGALYLCSWLTGQSPGLYGWQDVWTRAKS